MHIKFVSLLAFAQQGNQIDFQSSFSGVERTSNNQILQVHDEERWLGVGSKLRDRRSQHSVIAPALHCQR